MPAKRTPPWNKKNPRKAKGSTRKLAPAEKAAAKARAKKAGRRYPNLVDNMWAASRGGSGKARS